MSPARITLQRCVVTDLTLHFSDSEQYPAPVLANDIAQCAKVKRSTNSNTTVCVVCVIKEPASCLLRASEMRDLRVFTTVVRRFQTNPRHLQKYPQNLSSTELFRWLSLKFPGKSYHFSNLRLLLDLLTSVVSTSTILYLPSSL